MEAFRYSLCQLFMENHSVSVIFAVFAAVRTAKFDKFPNLCYAGYGFPGKDA